MTGTEIYKRTATYESDAKAIRLRAPQWKLLLAFDGQRDLAEVALGAGIPLAEATPLAEQFLNWGWIEEQVITLDQFLKRPGVPEVSVTVASPALAPNKPEEVVPPPLPSPSRAATGTPSPRGPMRLSAVVDYIISLVGNISLGQLLVYRVFLRVPPELLQAEDIASISLANDNSLIQGEALQKAIANAVNEVAKRPLPDGVFVAT